MCLKMCLKMSGAYIGIPTNVLYEGDSIKEGETVNMLDVCPELAASINAYTDQIVTVCLCMRA